MSAHMNFEARRGAMSDRQIRNKQDSLVRSSGSNIKPFTQRVLIVAAVVVALLLVGLLLWHGIEVLLLSFAGLLLAVFLRGLSTWVSAHTGLSDGWSLLVVVMVLIGLTVLSGWLLAPEVARQTEQLFNQLPGSVQQLRQYMMRFPLTQQAVAQVPSPNELLNGSTNLLSRATGIVSATFGLLFNLIVIAFVGLYLAATPQLYLQGIVRLVPVARRDRAREVLATLGYTLRWWLIGRIFSMSVIGVSTAIGLWLLGMPLALTFGILAALLTFIPNFGPVISAIPPTLIALTQSPTQALYVVALYTATQFVESYLLTPMVQQRAVEIPPVLVITAQIFLGVVFGVLGLVLATPLTAAAMVLVKMLYVEDVLGDQAVNVKGEDQAYEEADQVAPDVAPHQVQQ